MKKLAFQYSLKIRTDAPIAGHHFTLRCIPSSDAMQSVHSLSKCVTPASFLSEGQDQWKNAFLYGACKEPHQEFSVQVSGIVSAGLDMRIPVEDPAKLPLFLIHTPLTAPDENIKALSAEIKKEQDPYLDACNVMHKVHKALIYVKGATNTETSAAQALAAGKGVCQDYAHLFIAFMRLRNVPARYAAGITCGEGESHAWVEVSDGTYWYPLDPTADKPVTDAYIRFSSGRDADDCMINRGIFLGNAAQKTEVFASVTEV